MEHEFHGQIFEKYSIKKIQEILPVGTELFLTDGQTDMKKLIFAFRNFVSEPKKNYSHENL